MEDKDETHIDNLLSLFGARSESEDSKNLPYAGRGQVNPPSVDPNAPLPRTSGRAPTHAQNQAAAKAMAEKAAKSVANMDFGDIDPRIISYVPGAIAGAKYGPAAMEMFDPLARKEREVNRLLRWQALHPSETAEDYAKRLKLHGASATRNYANVMPGQQMPEAVLQTVEDMTKGNPRGLGAYDVAARDAKNMATIHALGGGHYELQGEGLPAKTPLPFQLMAEPGTFSSTGKAPLTQAANAASESKFMGAMKKIPEYAGSFFSHPNVQGAMHGANILGTTVQGLTDIYNKDPVGGLITTGQAAGSLAGFPELAIPLAELARYYRSHPEISETPEPKKQFVHRGFGLD